MLMTADLHLTDAPADEYRWAVFNSLRNLARSQKDGHLLILGDITDRKDRHSGDLVNRLVSELVDLRGSLGGENGRIDIIMGNHDKPLKGTPFWSFFDQLEGISFYTEPFEMAGGLLMLPYADNPKEAWTGLKLSRFKAIFMHQTVTGVVENGMTLTNEKMPIFPRGIPIYSGDIHTHQKVGAVQYVGAPHPVKFGDNYDCRLLVLDDQTYQIGKIVPLFPKRKHMIDVGSIAELMAFETRPGDQARIRYSVPIESMEQWPVWREAIMDWAAKREVVVASAEALVDTELHHTRAAGADVTPDLYTEPHAVLRAFGEAEGIEDGLLSIGQSLLQECLDSNLSK